MKKLLLFIVISVLTSSCYMYVRETGRFHHRRVNLQRYHRMGINGFHIRNHEYSKQLNKNKPKVK
jgi:hypothetical protein